MTGSSLWRHDDKKGGLNGPPVEITGEVGGMCIIIYKEAGRGLPVKALKKMWGHNPHGAGYWIEKSNGAGVVKFSKGFLTFQNFMDAIRTENLTSADRYAIHFRYATHGGISPSLCHPFIVDGQWWQLSGRSSQIIMHNGIININTSWGRSDTAEYVISRLSRRNNLCHPRTVRSIARETSGSRLLIYDGGKVRMTGEWFERDGY